MRIDPSMVGIVSGGLGESGAGGERTTRATRGPSSDSRVFNEQGQSLYEVRGELTAAAREALSSSASGQASPSVDEAIDRALEDNGFDAGAVRAALRGRSELRDVAEAPGRTPGVPVLPEEPPPPPQVDVSLPGPDFGVPDPDSGGVGLEGLAIQAPVVSPDPADILVDALLTDLQPGSLVSVYA